MTFLRSIIVALGLGLLAGALAACASTGLSPTSEGGFTLVATHRGLGSVLSSLVGPGPTPGSERLYQSYFYEGDRLDLVVIDPESGEHRVFPSPLAGETGAWAMVWGPDRNLYLGTLPHAHIFMFDPRTGTFTDKGRPARSEQYVWGLALGADGRLYGCTYPSAKLIRYDPTTGLGEDLGRMDPTEQYARSVATSDDGFVYVGIGYARANLVAYEIATGKQAAILPPEYRTTGAVFVSRRVDGRIYATIGPHTFRAEGWKAVPVDAAPSILAATQLQDGRIVSIADGQVRLTDLKTNRRTERPFLYAGKEKTVFRLGIGPDGLLYGSGYMPAQFFRFDPARGELEKIGVLGGGELFSLVAHEGRVLSAAYYGEAPLMSFDPRQTFAPGPDASSNPLLVHYAGEDMEWRPVAMIVGPDERVYLGAVPGYGKLGGPLTVWDPRAQTVESYPHLIADQSVISLAAAQGRIVGGTTVTGGGGSHPTQTQAALFVWDPEAKRTVFVTGAVQARAIVDLIAAPDGLVYGFGDNRLFAFDPVTETVMIPSASRLPGRLVNNSIGVGPDGRLWGLTNEGIFAVDMGTRSAKLIAGSPDPISAGFALQDGTLYFASSAKIYRYKLPPE